MRQIFILMLCLTVMNKTEAQVSPLLTTTWDQTCNYNANCPTAISGGACTKVFTGCGATAMAQVLKFWQHPTSGWASNTYTPGGYPVQTANFAAATYNYALMPNSISSANASIAQLMHHCGVSVNMQYSGTSSNSSFSDIRVALKKYFKYSVTTKSYMKWMLSDSAWAEIIKEELDAGRPVIFSGSSHFWVVDGYQFSPALQFHMNWGWGGTYNGWYALNDLTPGSLSFPNSSIIVGLKPALPFEISPDTIAVSYLGSSFNQYEVSTEFPFTATTAQSWITIDSTSLIIGYHTDNFTVPTNTSYFERYGYIVFNAGTYTDTIVVYQPGHPNALDISTDTLFYSYTGGLQNFDIWSNTTWNITNAVTWATPSLITGTGSNTIGITAAANTGAQRFHTYSISNGTFTRLLVLVQEASPTASVNEEIEACNNLFPNPVTSILHLSCLQTPKVVSVFDSQAKLIVQYFNTNQLNMNGIKNGIYLLKAEFSNGNIWQARIVKD